MGVALLGWASAAGFGRFARPAAAPRDPSTIIVTGERVKRSLRDTASSVSVVSRRDIEAASADRVEQMLELVPNVQLGDGGEGPTIRGQDTTGASSRCLPSSAATGRARRSSSTAGARPTTSSCSRPPRRGT